MDGMRWFQGTYTQRFNARHKVWGHLFQGRYKALLVDGGGEYFRSVANYIHLNPARARCFDLESGRLADYRWSSHVGYLRPKKRLGWLAVERVLGNLGFGDDISGRAKYRHYMQKRVLEVLRAADPGKIDADWDRIRRGWVFGSDEFRQEIQGVDAVIDGGERWTTEMFDRAGQLKILAPRGVGVGSVDVAAATKHGVWVTNTLGATDHVVADFVLDLIICLPSGHSNSVRLKDCAGAF